MNFSVRVTPAAHDDMTRQFDHLLERATSQEDLDLAVKAQEALQNAIHAQLARSPFSFRKAGTSATRRELVTPLGSPGYVALFEIADASTVVVLAVRHQRDDDNH